MSNKWCKWYCSFPYTEKTKEDCKKVCNKPDCHNFSRSKEVLRKISEELLKEVERNLY